MPRLSLLFGSVLVALGVVSFVATGSTHYTALIPAGFGALLIVCGAAGLAAPQARMHVMHVAALLGLIGAGAGLGMSLPKLPALLAASAVIPVALWMKLSMGAICLVFLALCVKSFIDARRARLAGS